VCPALPASPAKYRRWLWRTIHVESPFRIIHPLARIPSDGTADKFKLD
jgi:hypothetical protein